MTSAPVLHREQILRALSTATAILASALLLREGQGRMDPGSAGAQTEHWSQCRVT